MDARQHARELKKAFLTQTTVLMTTAFGFAAALVWNGAIQSLFKTYSEQPAIQQRCSAMPYL